MHGMSASAPARSSSAIVCSFWPMARWPGARALGLNEVAEDVDYGLIISTCAGAWRYLIGDTIRFTDLDSCEIKITGRTKQFLSICGEHLSVDNMTEGVLRTANDFKVNFESKTIDAFNNHLDNVKIEIDNKNPLYNAYIQIDSIKNKNYKIRDFSIINITHKDTLSFRTEFLIC